MEISTATSATPVVTGPAVREGTARVSDPFKTADVVDTDSVTLSPQGVQRSREESSSESIVDDDTADLLRSLEQRDLEVRTHEQAHKAVGGELAGAPSYSYAQGPDGKRYAVSGEVSIDISDVPGDPAATIEKMSRVRRAALAPAEPSAQDRQVAAQAAQKMTEARAELAVQQREALQAESDLAAIEQETRQRELEEARSAQSQAEDDDTDEAFVSVAERFAEYNARLRQINETLLRISMPPGPEVGSLLDDEA